MRIRNTSINCVLALSLVFLSGAAALAQTNPTGVIKGRVADAQGGVLPGVTVTVSSPSLQGVRMAVTSANGDYTLPFLSAATALTLVLTTTLVAQTKPTVKIRAPTHDDSQHAQGDARTLDSSMP